MYHQVEEVRAWKDELLSQRRETMQRKLETANEKRNLQLKLKVRKAHEEENKVCECEKKIVKQNIIRLLRSPFLTCTADT